MNKKVWKRFLTVLLVSVLASEPGGRILSQAVAEAGVIGISGDRISEDGISGDRVSGNGVSGDRVSGNGVSGDKISGDGVSGDRISGNEALGTGISGNGFSGNEALGTGISGNGFSGDEVLGTESSGDMVSGNEALGNEIPGNGIPGDEIPGNEVSGSEIIGEGASVNSVSGNAVSGDMVSGNGQDARDIEEEENAGKEQQAASSTAAGSCQVTFLSKGGSAVAAQTVEKGANVKKPANPIRSQYLFSGWYKGDKAYDFTEPVTENLTLSAKWSKVSTGKTKIQKLSNTSKGILKVKLKKVKGAAGYQVQVSTDPAFKTQQAYTDSGRTVTVWDRYKNKTYYVRARAYKLDSGKGEVYGGFSGKSSLKVTKGIQKVEPSKTVGTITSVSLPTKKRVRVKAKVDNYVKSVDSYYYLFHLSCSASKVAVNATPDAKVKKSMSVTLRTPLGYGTSSSKLQSKFVLAVKTSKPGTYTIICTPQFIANPEKLADYRYAFPKTSTKKGLQVNPNYISDAVDLGIKHTTYNMCLDDLIASPAQQNDTQGISFYYNGSTYWFNREIVEGMDYTLDKYKANNMVVSAILLFRWRDDLSYLIPEAARESGHNYYALNTSEPKARKHWEAVFTFLAQRYASNKRIANWILGNEVNNYGEYQYTGSTSLSNNVKLYANAYRLAYIAVRSVYAKARVYISLNQVWTYLVANSHTGKQFLDKFADYWETYGDLGNFYIAFHPYPAPLEDPAFWNNSKDLVSSSISSPCISMSNLSVLTNYVKQKWGSGTRIILSEQGFTSNRYGLDVPELQAAAIAYAYYLAEFNNMVDAFILHRHVDHQVEQAMGLYLGLWSNNGDSANPATIGQKKYAWDVYKEIDTKQGAAATKFALSYIGASSWKSVVPGYTTDRFS